MSQSYCSNVSSYSVGDDAALCYAGMLSFGSHLHLKPEEGVCLDLSVNLAVFPPVTCVLPSIAFFYIVTAC